MAPVIAEQRLARGPYAESFGKLLRTAVGNPGALRREALDMVLFLLQQALRDQHGHRDVLVSRLCGTLHYLARSSMVPSHSRLLVSHADTGLEWQDVALPLEGYWSRLHHVAHVGILSGGACFCLWHCPKPMLRQWLMLWCRCRLLEGCGRYLLCTVILLND